MDYYIFLLLLVIIVCLNNCFMHYLSIKTKTTTIDLIKRIIDLINQ